VRAQVQTVDIAAINALSDTVLAAVFEHYPPLVAAIAKSRPFASVGSLLQQVAASLATFSSQDQQALLEAFPQLVSSGDSLGPRSQAEHRAAGLTELTRDEHETFARLNHRYRQKFGFPFVLCAKDHRKDEILEIFARRLENCSEIELATAIAQVKRIFWHRLVAVSHGE
jgi:2-oxo-4-hydroxy-4-carboxy-5-ureidoimidazoline decarboxylase